MIKQSLRRCAALLCLVFSLGSLMTSTAYALDINSATAAELQQLKGVGPKRAEAIIRYRDSNGPFKTREELLDVPGIGSKVLSDNTDLIELPAMGQGQAR